MIEGIKYDHALTTVDNPFNPFTHWQEWFEFDTRTGYHTSALLARIVTTSYALSPADQELSVELAIDEIVDLNVSGMHKKISQVRQTES